MYIKVIQYIGREVKKSNGSIGVVANSIKINPSKLDFSFTGAG